MSVFPRCSKGLCNLSTHRLEDCNGLPGTHADQHEVRSDYPCVDKLVTGWRVAVVFGGKACQLPSTVKV